MPSLLLFIILIGPAFLSSFSIHVFAIAVLIIMSWICLLTNILNTHVERSLKMSRIELICFNALIFVLVLYSVKLNYRPIESLTVPLFMVHTFLFAGMIWILFVVSRTLIYAESQNTSSKPKLFLTLVLFWMFPIGVFFLQPRIIRILGGLRVRP